ncbi:MAG: hypothetical protein PHD72_04465 [Patescibacteria group bacterium]|nr:hypothetical protein [Patescibacteria group bacterium]
MKLKYPSEDLVSCWFKMSICEQLGNVGSEVGRAVNWRKKENNEQEERSLARAFELLDLTVADKRWRGGRKKELYRAREILADAFYGENEYKTTPGDMEKYFYHYAVAARNKF